MRITNTFEDDNSAIFEIISSCQDHLKAKVHYMINHGSPAVLNKSEMIQMWFLDGFWFYIKAINIYLRKTLYHRYFSRTLLRC